MRRLPSSTGRRLCTRLLQGRSISRQMTPMLFIQRCQRAQEAERRQPLALESDANLVVAGRFVIRTLSTNAVDARECRTKSGQARLCLFAARLKKSEHPGAVRLLARRPRRDDSRRHRAQANPRTASADPCGLANPIDLPRSAASRKVSSGTRERAWRGGRMMTSTWSWCCSAGCRAALPPVIRGYRARCLKLIACPHGARDAELRRSCRECRLRSELHPSLTFNK